MSCNVRLYDITRHIWVRYDRLNTLTQRNLTLDGLCVYVSMVVGPHPRILRFPQSGMPNTSPLRHLCNIFTRPSDNLYNAALWIRCLFRLIDKHGDCSTKRVARVQTRETPAYTRPVVLEFAILLGLNIIALEF
jgi:hypothetical protein